MDATLTCRPPAKILPARRGDVTRRGLYGVLGNLLLPLVPGRRGDVERAPRGLRFLPDAVVARFPWEVPPRGETAGSFDSSAEESFVLLSLAGAAAGVVDDIVVQASGSVGRGGDVALEKTVATAPKHATGASARQYAPRTPDNRCLHEKLATDSSRRLDLHAAVVETMPRLDFSRCQAALFLAPQQTKMSSFHDETTRRQAKLLKMYGRWPI